MPGYKIGSKERLGESVKGLLLVALRVTEDDGSHQLEMRKQIFNQETVLEGGLCRVIPDLISRVYFCAPFVSPAFVSSDYNHPSFSLDLHIWTWFILSFPALLRDVIPSHPPFLPMKNSIHRKSVVNLP